MDTSFMENWATQLRKGLLELCILNAIKGNRVYGYEVVKKLRDVKGLVISEGTIYPILSRFKQEGLVRTTLEESQEGPARKYYELTAKGTALLSLMNEHWDTIKRGADAIRQEKER